MLSGMERSPLIARQTKELGREEDSCCRTDRGCRYWCRGACGAWCHRRRRWSRPCGNKLTCFDGTARAPTAETASDKYGVATLEQQRRRDPDSEVLGRLPSEQQPRGQDDPHHQPAGLQLQRHGNGRIAPDQPRNRQDRRRSTTSSPSSPRSTAMTVRGTSTSSTTRPARSTAARRLRQLGGNGRSSPRLPGWPHPFIIADDAGTWTVFNVKLGRVRRGLKK